MVTGRNLDMASRQHPAHEQHKLAASRHAAATRPHHEVAHHRTHRNADEAIEAKAARVGADILAQYRLLAAQLRQKGRDETATVAREADPAVRAAHRCASELYETAASELDDLVADLLDGLERAPTKVMRTPVLRVLDGGRAETNLD
jgi:uncharacterized protein YcbX